ncbi:MAG: hypothetical protein LBS17_00590 [Actinomycetes bacterium]|jgi:hypothetical protein|nr:hypothetical protein [Actinomycetes bacterium]
MGTEGKIEWVFPPAGGGDVEGLSSQDTEAFRGEHKLENLVREICQNSLDARSPHCAGAVKVTFRLDHAKADDCEPLSDYRRILRECREYWSDENRPPDSKLRDFLGSSETLLSQQHVPYLVVSDYGTRGLTGSRKSVDQATLWSALTHSSGVSQKEGSSGGSFGIGKSAPFACSGLRMVFYNTFAEDKERAFKGVARLAATMHNGERTRGIGYYARYSGAELVPIFPEDDCVFRDVFNRNEQGTDIIILGFEEQEDWYEVIEKAAIENFFVAISQGKLEIQTGDTRILNSANLGSRVDKLYDPSDLPEAIEYYQAFRQADSVHMLSVCNVDDVKIYLKQGKNYSNKRGFFRNGMFIHSKKKNFGLKHYAATVVVTGKELGGLLKEAEPAKHDKWDPKLITDTKKQDRVSGALKVLQNKLREFLEKELKNEAKDYIDADISDWLPDSADDLPAAGSKPVPAPFAPEIGITQSKRLRNPAKRRVSAKKALGTADDAGSPGNKSTNPDAEAHTPPKALRDEEGGSEGIAPGQGKKHIDYPSLKGQRVVPVSQTPGTYSVILEPEKDLSGCYLSFTPLGDDNSPDAPLAIKSYSINGEPAIPVNETELGPVSLRANTKNKLEVILDNSERIVVDLTVETRGDQS